MSGYEPEQILRALKNTQKWIDAHQNESIELEEL